jgi:DNA N-6-adenine-methyltransferase (Dam)/Protein of unknown function (DUF3102)
MSAALPPVLVEEIEREHDAALGAARASLKHAAACGRLLLEAKASVPHGRWLPWIEANLSFCARQAQKYMRLAERGDQVRIENSHLTIDAALAALADHRDNHHTLRVMGSSESPEWYTPQHILDRAVATLAEIDLDPCWHPDSPVRATTTYTAAHDGLSRPWIGRVWLNPPYGRAIHAWVEKLVAEYNSGAVSEAIALVPARVDTDWFRLLDPFPRCFVDGRLTFVNAEHPAPFPSAIVYLGRNIRYFAKIFGAVGGIWVQLDWCEP